MNWFKKNKKLLLGLLIIAGVFVCLNFVQAQDTGLETVGEEAGIETDEDIRVLIARIIRIVFGFLGVIALLLVLYGGFVWMTAGGDPEKVNKAKKILINAFIGLAIMLLAFSITSFIISRLQEAVLGPPPEFEDGDGFDGDGGIPSGAFKVKSIQPVGALPIYNVVVKSTFNQKLDQEMDNELLANNFEVYDVSADQLVSGDVVISNYTLKFTPNQPCPEPNQDLFCFEKLKTYRVTLKSGIRDETGDNLFCGLGSVCSVEFRTGELIDTQEPSAYITSPYNNERICNEFYDAIADVDDDSAISIVNFYLDDQNIGAVAPPPDELVSSFIALLNFEVPLNEEGPHTLYVEAEDIDNNMTQSNSKTFIVPIAHCCNEVQDSDETGVDCGGVDCGACAGEPCDTDEDCADGFCSDGVCVSYPTITSLSHTEGAAGNLITIWGSGFGDYVEGQSIFEFTGPGGTLIEAGVGCDPSSSWTKSQVVVKVPDDAVTGPLKITNAAGFWDDTENDRGWEGPFIINPDLSWPGLCNVVNAEGVNEGEFEQIVTANGENFGTAQGKILFGEFEAPVTGTWSDTTVTGISLPNIAPGRALVNVESAAEELSNPVEFFILSTEKLPNIEEVNPDNGGIGQYVELIGTNFGNSPLPVFFLNEALEGGQMIADTVFPEGCSDSYWSDTKVIIKVPPGISQGQYLIQMKSENVESNQMPFAVTDAPPGPGICGLDPDNGPVGTFVDVLGEGFDINGTIQFSENQGSTISDALDTLIQTRVPALAVSGPVQYFNPEGIGSNTMNFTVGACTPESCQEKSIIEGETYECCTTGVCQPEGQCEDVVGAGIGEYVWMFSTGKLPIVPRVIEDPTCDDNIQSPSPWIDSEDACTNALIGARFNIDVQMANMPSKIKVARCNNQNEECSFVNCQSIDSDCFEETVTTLKTAGTEGNGFLSNYFVVSSLSGSPSLLPNRWYQVTILGGDNGVKSPDNVAMPQDYVWRFKTKETPCEIADVLVEPSPGQIDEFEGTELFNVFGKAENCNILDAGLFDWDWQLTNEADKASLQTITYTDIINVINEQGEEEQQEIIRNDQAEATGLEETDDENPVVVDASTTSEETGVTQSDDVDLFIDFTDPRVIDYGPECDTACINAEIWATFNTRMDESTMLIPNLRGNLENIFVYKCSGQNCLGLTPVTANFFGIYQDETKTVKINIHEDSNFEYLEQNTYYRVLIKDDVQSQSGINLTGLNFDYDQDGFNDSFSWIFRTKNDDTPCDMDRAEVLPPVYETSTPLEQLKYLVNARGAPDECNPNGQLLNPFDFNWSWNSTKMSVAEITSENVSTEFPSDTCSVECLNLGSSVIESICGNGGTPDYGEECDDGNSNDGDGCSSRCLLEPVADVSAGGTCGNEQLDIYEECDYARAEDADICTPGCQLAGSTISGYTCGNNNIDPGEDCDDGNNSSGDGCSKECLWEGSDYTFDQVQQIPVCGNGEVEAGEDCDDGDFESGDGCSSMCLAEGSQAVCGNGGDPEVGENCDDGNINDGDGCSSVCLNEGSDWAYGSFCGNGIIETGESCDAEGGNYFGSPEQLVTVTESLPAGTNEDTTNIAASAQNFAGVTKEGIGTLTFLQPFCISIDAQFTELPEPGSTDVCRNTAIQIIVNQPVQQSGINEAISLYGPCELIEVGASFPEELSPVNWFRKIVKRIKKLFSPSANAFGLTFDCSIEIEKINVVENDGQTTITVFPKDLLPASAPIQVDYSGLRDLCGESFGLNNFMFTTGPEDKICLVDYVNVIPADKFITEADYQQVYQAEAKSNDASAPLNPIPDFYSWSWSWDLESNLNIPQDVQLTSLVTMGPEGEEVIPDQRLLETGGNNGQGDVIATVSIEESEFGDIGNDIVGKGHFTIFICENPWIEELDEFERFQHIYDGWWKNFSFNFKTLYCRDYGDPDKTTDDLPNLRVIKAPDPEFATSPWDEEETVVIKEYFLLRDDNSPDAIALRVYTNKEGVSPGLWYDLHVPNPGQYGELSLDCIEQNGNAYCYRGIQDGRTVYISASNMPDAGVDVECEQANGGDFECESVSPSTFYNNIFVFSYSENADTQTLEMYNQLLNNIRFNINIPDTLPEDKLSIIRDTQRIHDIVYIRGLINSYFEQNGRVPLLNTDGSFIPGTYVSGQAVSTWPSWDIVFGNMLGTTILPKDPLNDFGKQCIINNFDPLTCYNSETEDFFDDYSKQTAHVYDYKIVEGGYLIYMNFENDFESMFPPICTELTGVVCN